MITLPALTALVLALPTLALAILRLLDARADRREWTRLAALQPAAPARFDPAVVADLPDPARRYFEFAITPDALLRTVAEIDMEGRFGMGTKAAPGYRRMEARQILAAPHGFVWRMRTRSGLPISGSDAAGWTRFRILGLIPVARLGGTVDHARAAYGRYAAEAAFWTPAALLPGPGVTWEAVDMSTARVTLTHGGLTQAVDLTVDPGGRPLRVTFLRWSDANPDKVYRLQPFGGELSDFREVEGFRLPLHVEAGNMFGTEDYFPFFIVDIREIRFPSG